MKKVLPLLLILLLAGCDAQKARDELKKRGVEASNEALFSKAKEGDAEAVKLLVRGGRSPNAVEKWSGRTPLMFAAEKGNLEVVEALIVLKADVNARIVPKVFRSGLPLPGWESRSERPTPGWTALMLAIQYGHDDVTRALLKAGAKVNAKGEPNPHEAFNDTTPLMLAISKGQTEIARLLIEAGADVNASDYGKRTVLMLARNVETLQLLQKAGVNLNQKDAGGRTALWTAVSMIDEKMIRFLVKNGADPNARDNYGTPVIMSALGKGANALVELGANVDAKDAQDRKSTRLNSSHIQKSRMPSSA